MAARRNAQKVDRLDVSKLVDVKADVEAGRGDHAGLHNEEREAIAALNAAVADLAREVADLDAAVADAAREVAALKAAQSKSD